MKAKAGAAAGRLGDLENSGGHDLVGDQPTESETTPPEGVLQGARILIVEDDMPLAEALSQFFLALECEVVTVESGEEALESSHSEKFDVLVSDFSLPGITGLDLTIALREESPLTMSILISGRGDADLVLECLRGGALDFLRKPFDFSQLQSSVVTALERKGRMERESIRRIGLLLFGGHDYEITTQRLVELLRSVVGADVCAILTPEGWSGFQAGLEARSNEAADQSSVLHLLKGLREEVRATGWDEMSAGGPVLLRDRILFPLVRNGSASAVLCLSNAPGEKALGLRDLRRVEVLAEQILVAFENAHQARRLQSADRLITIGELTASVTHEVNNVLAYLASNVDFVSEELGSLQSSLMSTEDGRPGTCGEWCARLGVEGIRDLVDAAREASEGAQRVVEIVREMRTFAQAGGETCIEFDPRSCVESAVKLVAGSLVPELSVISSDETVPMLRGNPGSISQVIVNLLLNASQAIEESGIGSTIQVVFGRKDEDFLLAVSDDGPGIPTELSERVFEPFLTTKRGRRGTGLGLSISRDIAERNGGSLTLDTRVTEGASFVLRLPCDPQ